jgi:hypothetical protein
MDFKNIDGGSQSKPWFRQEDMWRLEEDYRPKSSLIETALVVPAIAWLREVVAQGHIKRGSYQKKELMPDTLKFHRRAKWKVVGAIKPAPGS